MNNPPLSSTTLERLRKGALETTHLPDGSAVMLDMARNRVLTLSETAAFIVARLQTEAPPDEETLAVQLAERFEVDQDTALRDIRAFLAELQETFEGEDPGVKAP